MERLVSKSIHAETLNGSATSLNLPVLIMSLVPMAALAENTEWQRYVIPTPALKLISP